MPVLWFFFMILLRHKFKKQTIWLSLLMLLCLLLLLLLLLNFVYLFEGLFTTLKSCVLLSMMYMFALYTVTFISFLEMSAKDIEKKMKKHGIAFGFISGKLEQ